MRKLRFVAVAVAVAVAVLVGITPITATASETGKTTAGMTKSEFISASGVLGVPEAVANDAWGDHSKMARIPVTSGGNEGWQAASSSLAPAGVTAVYSGTCLWEVRNIFTTVLIKLWVNKTWTGSNSEVSSPSS